MKKLLLLTPILFFLTACTLNDALLQEQEHASTPNITILEQRMLIYPPKNSLRFSEISDLAYDKKNKLLYMIGDKGTLYTFSATFNTNKMQLNYLNVHKIREKGKEAKEKKSYYDTEGLTLDNKNQLYLSFEKQPRITTLSKKGFIQKNQSLTKELKKKKNYYHSNKIFEALVWHPTYGLLTAGEYPLHKKKKQQQTIYSTHGKKWHFKMQNHENSAITAIEIINNDELLILERSYTGIFDPLHITLTKLYLKEYNQQRHCKTEVLASFHGQLGGSVNNYEGLAKVGENRFIMISDNNNKSILPTELIYFKVNP